MSDDAKKPSPAYVSYTTFKNTIKNLSHNGTLPARIDNSALGHMSGSGRNQMLGAMRFFSLIDEQGTPSAQLKKLATADENGWNKAMEALIQQCYSPQLAVLETGTPDMLRDSFGDIGGIIKPAVRFLLAVCKDTGVKVRPEILRDAKGQGKPRKRRAKPEAESSQNGVAEKPAAQSTTGGERTIAMALLEKFPAFDPIWAPEQQKAWFSAYEKLIAMNGAAKSAENPAT